MNKYSILSILSLAVVSQMTGPVANVAHAAEAASDSSVSLPRDFLANLMHETLANDQDWTSDAAERVASTEGRETSTSEVALTSAQRDETLQAMSERQDYISHLVAITNLARMQYSEENGLNLRPLRVSPELTRSAQWMAYDMWLKYYFSHTDSDGHSVSYRASRFKYPAYRALGENIAAGQPSPEAVLEAWENSPGHWANIVSPYYQEIGIGYMPPGSHNQQSYWVQDFGTRMSSADDSE